MLAERFERDVELVLATVPPFAPRSRGALVVLSGLPGSGKSAVARELAARTGAVVLESDALRRRMFERPAHSPNESYRLFGAIREAACRLLAQRAAVVLDATNLAHSERRPFIDAARRHGARAIVVVVRAPEEAVLERLRRRQLDARSMSDAGPEVYFRMKERLEPVRGPHHGSTRRRTQGRSSTLSRRKWRRARRRRDGAGCAGGGPYQ